MLNTVNIANQFLNSKHFHLKSLIKSSNRVLLTSVLPQNKHQSGNETDVKVELETYAFVLFD